MAWVQSFDEGKLNQKTAQKIDSAGSIAVSTKVPFFGSRDTPGVPHAFLTQWGPARVSGTHFHENDQFQVVVAGKGKLGRHSLAPYSVHFSRAYTPYGPLASDASSSLSYLVMRPRYDAGPQRLPRELEKLRAISNRRPLQIRRRVSFPPLQTEATAPNVMLQALPEMRNDDGLASYTLDVKPNNRAYAPDPSRSGGQYLVVVTGSLLHDDKEYKALTLVFVPSTEGAFEIRAGAEGLQAIVLDFPRPATVASITHAHQATSLKRWQCQLCGFAYDEAAGSPEDGIAPGTRWEDVPASWSCPDCSASKADFEMVEL